MLDKSIIFSMERVRRHFEQCHQFTENTNEKMTIRYTKSGTAGGYVTTGNCALMNKSNRSRATWATSNRRLNTGLNAPLENEEEFKILISRVMWGGKWSYV